MPYVDREKHRGYQRAWAARKRQERRLALLQGRRCMDCGFEDPRALEFHHRDPLVKDDAVMRMLTNRQELIDAEVEKCDVVCANCHSIRHHEARMSIVG